MNDQDYKQKKTQAEPKFKVGDHVEVISEDYLGEHGIIADIDDDGYILIKGVSGVWFASKNLKPYTDPSEGTLLNVNHSDINIDDLVAKGYAPDPTKDFDTIHKDNFRNERRLNIATQMIKAFMQCPEIIERISSAETDSLLDDILSDALYLTDRLIDECEKGGSDV